MNDLERRYRLLLLTYPRRDRSRQGDELLGTLLDVSAPGQRWPRAGEASALLRHGLRARLCLSERSGTGRAVAVAAGPGLGLSAGLALTAMLFGELPVWGADPGINANQFGYGPFETTGVWAYGCVLLAWLSFVAGRVRVAQRFSALACLAALGSYEMAGRNVWGRPSLTVLSTLVVCLLPLLLAEADTAAGSTRLRLAVLAAPLACAALAAVAFAGAPTGHPGHLDPRDVFNNGDSGLIGRLRLVLPAVTAIALLAAGIVASRVGRREVWSATTLLLVPATLVVYGGGGYGGRIYDPNWLPLLELLVVVAVVVPLQLVLVLARWRHKHAAE